MQIYTVSDLHAKITSILSQNFTLPITIEGEITSFKGASLNGHYYFNLKDEKSSICCVLFKGRSNLISTLPNMGKKVKITGRIETYSNSFQPSKYQIIVSNIQEVGLGNLYEKYLKLLNDLGNEGLFEDSNKNQYFSKFPKVVGVITSQTGAVIFDIIETIKMRNPFVKIILYPTQVQGILAAADILNGLKFMENHTDVETIILGRGGGSFEDLFCYNDEKLIRYIYSMKKQIISSVGHDKDRPLCDFVCDIRASTPTQAAMLVTPITFEDFKLNLFDFKSNIISNYNYFLTTNFQNLDFYLNNIFKSFSDYISKNNLKLDNISKQINLLSYTSVLNRGFSLTTDLNGVIIKDSKTLNSGDKIKTVLNRGELISSID